MLVGSREREDGGRDLNTKVPLVKQLQQNQFSVADCLLVNAAKQGMGFSVVGFVVVFLVLSREPVCESTSKYFGCLQIKDLLISKIM